ncbi:hypothetical protein FB45DRAFT_894441 [Roridomyces roridus]|uniref:Uncharacterized protein n=1 Tax=Roridomyces roridus TaxID=1738132 RepID=A0AAD7CI69_9AGAR|nr:hypothetical protein FB45DRAFT_894441 [Roridomyces roridus]
MSSGASSGWRSPSPLGMGEKELGDIIKDHFNIKPVVEQATGGWVSLSSIRLALIRDELQTQSPSSHQRHLLIPTAPSPIAPSPTILVPEPGTRHREDMAASQTPTVPTALEQRRAKAGREGEETVAREGEDGDGGYDSETVKADSDDGETRYDEVKVDVVPDRGDASEEKMIDDETMAPKSTEATVRQEKMAVPRINVDVSSLTSDD